MQANKVQNQTNVSAIPGIRQQSTPDVPFNQMLTQQMADRSNANDKSSTTKVNDGNKANEANKVNDSNQANKTDGAPKPAASADANASDTKVSDKDKVDDAKDIKSADSASGATPVSAEMMALLNQANDKASAVGGKLGKAGGSALTAASDISLGKDQLLKQEIKATPDGKSTIDLNNKELAEQSNANFAETMSSLEKTVDSKESLKLASAKLQDALPAVATGTPQIQPAALNAAQNVAHPTDKLTPQVGSPGWDQALGQKVVWMVAGSQQSASLTLNPPDLGPMQVVLNVSNGQADATFTANQPEVRQALEAALPKLREMMSEAGIQLGQTTISAGMPHQHNKPGEQGGQGSRSAGQGADTADSTAPRITGSSRITSGGQGLVDTFA